MSTTEQAYFWGTKWQKMEKIAEADIRSGKFSSAFSSAQDLLKHLKK